MNAVKQNLGGILICLFELLVGILLLMDPAGFTTVIFVVFGAVLAVVGIVSVVKYFRASPAEAALGQHLVKGLLALLVGGFCIVRSQWLIGAFPILTALYGAAVLVAGLGKIQWAVDMFRLKIGKWSLAALSALISVVCGWIILANPFTSTTVLWMFIAVSLIVEAVFDVLVLIFRILRSRPRGEEV